MPVRSTVRCYCALIVSLAGLLAMASITQAADEQAGALPLKKIVLYNAGVGYFQRSAEVEGTRQVDLRFNADDINDLLKSLVLEDLGGGQISTVTYGSRDPITRTLKTFAIDLTDRPTLFDLLGQIRGEQVEIEAPNKISGTIIGVEKRKHQVKDETIETEFLNLLTEQGLRSFALSTVTAIKLSNPQLDKELRQALSLLALAHSTDKKTVSLHFAGNGKRPVRVGYIQQMPIWKTSYRLVLSDNDPPFLQGWSIVENTTEDDWKDVSLTLVSGRPISFVMNLYQPLYVPRPEVEPELFASLRPQTYGQDLAEREQVFRRQAGDLGANANRDRGVDGLGRKAMSANPAPPAAPAYGAAGATSDMFRSRQLQDAKSAEKQSLLSLQQGVQSVAEASNVGELFQYEIGTPVTLPRQQSAMLPIVNSSVKGEKVSIYNQAVQAKHPLSGLRFTNSTNLHLMQGPITVFDGGAYAGDARIEDLQPGTERLISYALDLDTEVAPEYKNSPDELVSVRIVKGVVWTSRKFQRSQQFTIKNSGKKSKKVLVELPYDPNWKLVTPDKPTEKTRDQYRFAVTAEAGKPAKLVVDEEQINQQQIALSNLDDNTIVLYTRSKVVSEPVKQALAEVVKRKQALALAMAEQQQLEQQVKVIEQEQSRIRQNMEQLDRKSDLYGRYVKKFSDQEDQVEKLRDQIQAVQQRVAEQRKSLDEYLRTLDVG